MKDFPFHQAKYRTYLQMYQDQQKYVDMTIQSQSVCIVSGNPTGIEHRNHNIYAICEDFEHSSLKE